MRWLSFALLPLLLPAAGLAHTRLTASTPCENATVEASPGRVELVFENPVRLPFCSIKVTDAEGGTVRTDAPLESAEENHVLRASLVDDLPDGTYRVDWAAVSADGHRIEGTFSFEIAPAR